MSQKREFKISSHVALPINIWEVYVRITTKLGPLGFLVHFYLLELQMK